MSHVFSRRHFIAGAGLMVLTRYGTATGSMIKDGYTGGEPLRPELLEKWMSAWMVEASRQPVGALHLGRFAEPMYYLLQSITWKPNPGQKRFREVTAPVGFVTDLASIPRVFFSLLRPDGQYTYPAIVHDYLYWTQDRPRAECDMILKLGMEDFDVSAATINAIYVAVRTGGNLSWNNNAIRKRAGERRVLKTFPDDPRIRWEDWRKRTDVFK